MASETTLPAPRVIAVEGLGDLYRILVAEGYRVIGPSAQDGAIVLRKLSSAGDLPFGWGVHLEPGGYRVRRRDDTAAFGHSAGPQSWKRFLHPPRERLWSAARTPGSGFELSDQADEDEPPRYAFLGVRPCDLRAIAIQDQVLAQPGSRYAARRARLFIIAVNCTEPGETCFCASMGTGPGVDEGYDLALTEMLDEGGHRFLAEAGSQHGADVLAWIPSEPTGEAIVREARSAVEAAAGRMGRQMETGDLRELMAGSHQAERCGAGPFPARRLRSPGHHLALIARYGAAWFRSVGTPAEPGSMLATVLGAVREPAVLEIAVGTPIARTIDLAGGPSAPLQALLLGGYFGDWVHAGAAMDLPFSSERLADLGAGPGAGVITALPACACGLRETARVVRYLADESAGQCGPCRFGLDAISGQVERLAYGRNTDPGLLRRWLGQVDGRGACAHPSGVVRLVRSSLRIFDTELRQHAMGWCCGTTTALPVPSGGNQ